MFIFSSCRMISIHGRRSPHKHIRTHAPTNRAKSRFSS
nr:MAG TPA: hypothetical protein [Caudoviricetes sp.]